MNTLSETLTKDIKKMLKRPSRAGISIPGSVAHKIIESLDDMKHTHIRSLHEYLTVLPSLSDEKVHIKESNGKLRAYNIVCHDAKRRVLIDAFGPNIELEYT